MISYATIGTDNLPRALAFYDALLADFGGKRLFEFDRGCLYARSPGAPILGVMKPHDGQPANPGNGTMIAIGADDPAMVDKLHAKALELGGTDEGTPGSRPGEGSPFYGAYFRDLDGNKLAVYHWRKPG